MSGGAAREVDGSHALVVCSSPVDAKALMTASLKSRWLLQPFEMVRLALQQQGPL